MSSSTRSIRLAGTVPHPNGECEFSGLERFDRVDETTPAGSDGVPRTVASWLR